MRMREPSIPVDDWYLDSSEAPPDTYQYLFIRTPRFYQDITVELLWLRLLNLCRRQRCCACI